MMPDRAVASPTAVTRTRRLPPATTVPATTLAPGSFGTGRDSPVIIDSSTSAAPSATTPSAGTRAPGSDQDQVACAHRGERDDLDSRVRHPFDRVREQGRQGIEGAASLGDRPHLQPVAEEHDGDKRRELPPDVDCEEAERRGEGGDEGNRDRQADQGHHPWLAVRQLAARAAREDEAAVKEDDRAKNRRDEGRSGKGRGGVPEPVLHIGRPDDDRDRQGEAQPDLVAEHRHGVLGVTIVTGGWSGPRFAAGWSAVPL